eukprot:m.984248 g.984248  ORF g.984248 m.984248 type:complete len:918 (+) comp23976_c0_seq2:211-2964(+)
MDEITIADTEIVVPKFVDSSKIYPRTCCSTFRMKKDAGAEVPDGYGYPTVPDVSIDEVRRSGFSRMKDSTYLDHAGATLYSEDHVRTHSEALLTGLYGNPHSANPSSEASDNSISQARHTVLRHFNVTEETHSVIFTAGATAGLKLVAECFTFEDESTALATENKEAFDKIGDRANTHASTNATSTPHDVPCSQKSRSAPVLAYLDECHTSAIGMRQVARARGVDVVCMHRDTIATTGDGSDSELNTVNPMDCNSLVVFPGQSNFCGRKFPLEWVQGFRSGNIDIAQCERRRWKVVLDAAALVSTSPLDLASVPADFVALSFYKMFGFPTGLGALIVRNDSVRWLQKTYFGGGTLDVYSATERLAIPRAQIHSRFEDGTVSFLDIAALAGGFAILDRLTMAGVRDHAFACAQYLARALTRLTHYNGAPVVRLYAQTEYASASTQGPIVNFNVRRADASWVGYAEFERLASIMDIHLRTGCFCNSGACHKYLDIDSARLDHIRKQGFTCGSTLDVIDDLPVGSIRVSFGYMSTLRDADTLVAFVKDKFVEVATPSLDLLRLAAEVAPPCETERSGTDDGTGREHTPRLTKIRVFPVKSCGGFDVDEWEITPQGLQYDRMWMVLNAYDACVTQKQVPKLCLVAPTLDRLTGALTLHAPGMPSIAVPTALASPTADDGTGTHKERLARVCNDKIVGDDCGDDVARWLSEFLGMTSRLVKQNPEQLRTCRLERSQRRLTRKAGSPLPTPATPTQEDSDSDSEDSAEDQKDRLHPEVPDASAAPAPLSLANESQFLLVNEASMAKVNTYVDGVESPIPVDRFRGNFVIDGTEAFAEDQWESLQIGTLHFNVVAPCQRCQMVCVNQSTGERTREPLIALSKFRRHKGITYFGQHLQHVPEKANGGKPFIIRTGDPIDITHASA